MRPLTVRGACPLVAYLVCGAAAASAQSFGLGEQTLTIPAAAFHEEGFGNTSAGHDSDGFLYSGPSGISAYVAPIFLPEGAEITGVCMDTYQFADGSSVHSTIQAVKLPDSADNFGVYEIPGTTITAQAPPAGYAHACNTDPVSYTFRESADVDGAGVLHLAHRLRVSMDPLAGLGAVRIRWRRQVSPAPGSPTFADVPESDGAFAFVEALVASGVTAGCGNGNYCPDAPLTRRQMAVFLSKALGLHWPN